MLEIVSRFHQKLGPNVLLVKISVRLVLATHCHRREKVRKGAICRVDFRTGDLVDVRLPSSLVRPPAGRSFKN